MRRKKKIKVYHIGEDGVLNVRNYEYDKVKKEEEDGEVTLLRIKTDSGYRYVPIENVATRKILGLFSEKFVVIDERETFVFEDKNLTAHHEKELFQSVFKGLGKPDLTFILLAIGTGVGIGIFIAQMFL